MEQFLLSQAVEGPSPLGLSHANGQLVCTCKLQDEEYATRAEVDVTLSGRGVEITTIAHMENGLFVI